MIRRSSAFLLALACATSRRRAESLTGPPSADPARGVPPLAGDGTARSSPTSTALLRAARRSTSRRRSGPASSSRAGAAFAPRGVPVRRGWSFERSWPTSWRPSRSAGGDPEGVDRRNERHGTRQGRSGPRRVRRPTRQGKGKPAGLVVWGQARELKSPEDKGVSSATATATLTTSSAFQVPPARGARARRPAVSLTAKRPVPAAAQPGASRSCMRPRSHSPSRALGPRRERAAARQRRLAQEGRSAGGHAADRVGRAVVARRAAHRSQARG